MSAAREPDVFTKKTALIGTVGGWQTTNLTVANSAPASYWLNLVKGDKGSLPAFPDVTFKRVYTTAERALHTRAGVSPVDYDVTVRVKVIAR